MTGVELWPVVSIGRPESCEEGVWVQDLLSNVLSDSTAYSTAIKSFQSLAARLRAKGLILSVENLPEKDAYAFQSFLRKIRGAIGGEEGGLLLAVEVPLPDESAPCHGQNHRRPFQDLEDIASIAHLVCLKAYKEPRESLSPGPWCLLIV